MRLALGGGPSAADFALTGRFERIEIIMDRIFRIISGLQRGIFAARSKGCQADCAVPSLYAVRRYN